MTDIFRSKSIRKTVAYTLAILTSLVTSSAAPSGQEVKTLVSKGWHPWYEVKVDPENPKNLIICGTKWDARQNAPFGFVYNSGDGARTWRTSLEDRHSAWVTEHSCAFGRGHAAYFISEAAAMVDGITHHELGTSRLYVSTDAGNHWSEGIRTGWADYSTSAVSFPGGSLYTFFNADTNEVSRHWGASVGLLRFSPDGKRVDGPFLVPEMKHVGYEGAFPSDAIALKSGRVVALYWGTRQTSTGREADLGIVRADASPEPHLDYREISQTAMGSECINFDTGSLAYDPDLNRLSVLYVHGCTETRLMLTISDDEGSTWTKSVPLSNPPGSSRKVSSPSLAALAPGILGLLWEDGETSGRWLFSSIRNSELVHPPAELSCSSKNFEVSNDALWTSMHQTEAPNRSEADQTSQSSITINVRTGLNSVWRTRGLAMAGNQLLGIWPSKERDGMRLYSQVLTAPGQPEAKAGCSDSDQSRETDVTDRIRLLYGGIQQFDSETKNLKICLALWNESDQPIRTPIMIDVQGLSSPLGTVSVVNGANRVPGADAAWDISSAITGNQVPPGMSTNPFCLSFHIDLPEKSTRRPKGVDLLTGKMKVYAETSDSPPRNK